MKYICSLILMIMLFQIKAQTIIKSAAFSLASPFVEPDGRNDYVTLSDNEFVTLAKTKGSQKGSSDFLLEKYDNNLNSGWQTQLTAESSEDYKELYFNGEEIILLSVIHLEKEKRTKLKAYAFDPASGKQKWNKEIESYEVQDFENHPHKGRVKESFIDVVCEHVDPDFVTPFEYNHHIRFSPDQSKFISWVYNYGEKNLTATLSLYDNHCNLISRGKISIDNDYTNYGFYVNNSGRIFIINANNFGKLNVIRYDLENKEFDLLELPGGNLQKDDFQAAFENDNRLVLANTEISSGKITGVMISRFDFEQKTVEDHLCLFTEQQKQSILTLRKSDKTMKGEEDWKDYDISNFLNFRDHSSLLVLEKRLLFSDGYPHIGRDVFDKSHKQVITGHVNAAGIILLFFDPIGNLKWTQYVKKNQIFPASDGLNTVSYSISEKQNEIKLLFATSENMDANLHILNLYSFDKETGNIRHSVLPNEEKLILVKDYTIWTQNELILVGKKGLLGKKSGIVRYKF